MTYLALLAGFVFAGCFLVVKKKNFHCLIFTAGILALLVGQFVFYQNTVLAFSFWLMLALSAVGWFASLKVDQQGQSKEREKVLDFGKLPELGLVFNVVFWLLLVAFAFFGFKMTKQYLAEINYRQYLRMPDSHLTNLERAANHFGQRAVYHVALSRAYLDELNRLLKGEEQDSQALANVLKSAVEESQKAVAAAPNSVAAYEAAGIVYGQIQGAVDGAGEWCRKSFEKALELEPDNPSFFVGIGNTYQAEGDQKQARQFWQKALEVKPDYTAASLLLAASEEAEGDKAAAIKRLEEAVKKNPWSAEAHFRLGLMYYNESKYDLAEEELLNALQISPNYSNALYSLGLVLQKKGDRENALKLFEKVLQLNPGNENVMKKIEELGGGEPQEDNVEE